jgi:arylsulfatase A-like enzyme
VVTNHTPWDNRNVTFLEQLNAAGYETAFIGKWHMPGERRDLLASPVRYEKDSGR